MGYLKKAISDYYADKRASIKILKKREKEKEICNASDTIPLV